MNGARVALTTIPTTSLGYRLILLATESGSHGPRYPSLAAAARYEDVSDVLFELLGFYYNV